MTKRKPATVGEILIEEFMQPLGLTQATLAKAMGVQRKHVNELCNNRRNVTAATALILSRVFGNSPWRCGRGGLALRPLFAASRAHPLSPPPNALRNRLERTDSAPTAARSSLDAAVAARNATSADGRPPRRAH